MYFIVIFEDVSVIEENLRKLEKKIHQNFIHLNFKIKNQRSKIYQEINKVRN